MRIAGRRQIIAGWQEMAGARTSGRDAGWRGAPVGEGGAPVGEAEVGRAPVGVREQCRVAVGESRLNRREPIELSPEELF